MSAKDSLYRDSDEMKVVLYEPCGSGGIFHYTFELADRLSRSGMGITVLTKEGHELSDLKRTFEITPRLGKSQIKGSLALLKAKLGGGTARTPRTPEKKEGQAGRRDKGSGRFQHLRTLVLWLELALDLTAQRPQIIHFQLLADPERDYYFLKILKFLGFKLVYTAHNLLPHVTTPRDKEIFRRIYHLVDRIVVHAAKNKEEMIEQFSVDPAKISAIPHGAYQIFYRAKRYEKQEAREILGIARDKKVILFFGAIQRYKGLEYLVDAFREVRKGLSNGVLLVVGQVPAADTEAVAYYSRFFESMEKEEGVIFRKGYLNFDEVGPYFSASDLVALPYVKTYQSGILALAYGAGRPVIVTDTGGLGEAVEEGKNGFVVPPQNVERLAEAIRSVFANPARAEEMGRHAKYLSEGKYSWEEAARQTAELYRSVIRNPAGTEFARKRDALR